MTDRATCEHFNFGAHVKVNRLSKEEGGPITGYTAEITVECVDCGTSFQFLGLPPGYDTQGATVSIDAKQANLALAPEGAVMSPLDRILYTIDAHKGIGQ